MLIKSADDKSQQLAELERQANGNGPTAKYAKADFYKLKNGIKGEKDAAYLIDFEYGDASKNWCVIHDLRLESAGRVAQIDHLLINRSLDFYVLESKHFNDGIRIKETGEFEVWNNYKKSYKGMASPIEQNERHIKVLKDAVAGIDLPVRLGLRIEPAFYSLVLVSASARIIRPKKFDSSRVIKADQLKKTISRDIEESSLFSTIASAAKTVASETIELVAKNLANLHKPLIKQEVGSTVLSRRSTTSVQIGPACKACGSSEGKIEYAYSYYFVCSKCGSNTSQKGLSCKQGHEAKLRKSKENFYLDCAQCSSSDPYHTNPAA